MIQYKKKFCKNPSFPSRDNVRKHYSGQNLTLQSVGVTLKIRIKSPKSMYLCKFGQNPSTGSEDILQGKSYADAKLC